MSNEVNSARRIAQFEDWFHLNVRGIAINSDAFVILKDCWDAGVEAERHACAELCGMVEGKWAMVHSVAPVAARECYELIMARFPETATEGTTMPADAPEPPSPTQPLSPETPKAHRRLVRNAECIHQYNSIGHHDAPVCNDCGAELIDGVWV